MRLKTRIKWWYYNTFLSVFLISHFNLWLTFTLDELYEIDFTRQAIHDWLTKMFDKHHDEMKSHKLEVHHRNKVYLYWYDSLGNKHLEWQLCIPTQFNFDKHKWRFAYVEFVAYSFSVRMLN